MISSGEQRGLDATVRDRRLAYARTNRWRAGVLLLYVIVFSLALYFSHVQDLSTESLVSLVRDHSVSGPLIFILAYALMIVMLLPTLPLNLAAGFIWGPVWGSVVSVLAASIAAAIAFLLARYVAFDFVSRHIRHRSWRLVRRAIRRNDWKIVAFVRVNPIFPFAPMSYVFGLTSIPLLRYLLATVISVTPPSFLIALLGYSARSLLLDSSTESLLKDVLLASFAITAVVALPLFLQAVVRRRRRTLRRLARVGI